MYVSLDPFCPILLNNRKFKASDNRARGLPIALMMETVSNSETSANLYQITRRNMPEDSYLHTRRRENLEM
jgi:hypothetical protein